VTEDELRALVRQAVQRALGGAEAVANRAPDPSRPMAMLHPSMARYHLPRAADDVMCVIEPAVGCDHCGYCQCHGH